MEEKFIIENEHFSGPFELLLELVEKRKFHINDIALAAVADSFLEYVRAQVELPKYEAAHFLVVASTLMLIKSHSLLPGLTLTPEEESSVEDLERRLKVFQKIKEGAEVLRVHYGKTRLFFREGTSAPVTVFAPVRDVQVPALVDALHALIRALPKKEVLPELIVKKVLSLEEAIDGLMNRVKHALSLSFKEYAGEKKEKVDVIVSFLGLLELVKQGAVHVTQHEHFSDIQMNANDVATPRY